MNDLPFGTNLKTVKFADDSNFLSTGKDLSGLFDNLNSELRNISKFFKANKLKLNAKKTKLVCFRKKGRDFIQEDYPVFLDGVKLGFEEEATFLGMRLDSHLSWEKHCNYVANTISKNNGVINRIKHLLPTPSLKTLYNSIILPHLQYGLAAWGGCSSNGKKRIVNIQKRAIRTVAKSYITAHTEPRMKKLQLLRLDDLYKQQCVTLIHDIINKRAPLPITGLISVGNNESQRLRSHSVNPLWVREPLGKCKVSSNSFRIKAPRSWNSLPSELQSIKEKNIFKSHLKRHLLTSYSGTAICTNPRCTDSRHHH